MMADAHRPAHRHDTHSLGGQVPATPGGRRLDGREIAQPFKPHGVPDAAAEGKAARPGNLRARRHTGRPGPSAG